MKKYFVTAICLLGLVSAIQAQVQLNIDAGLLENSTGTANEPVGGLLELVASPSGTFSAATSSSYVSGDNVLVASFAMNYGSGTSGETINNLLSLPLTSTTVVYSATNGYTTGIYSIAANEKIQLRWYPSLIFSTTTNYTTTAPTLLTTYGTARSDTVEFGPAGGDSAETAWIVPASGTVDLDYITTNDSSGGGTYSAASGDATNVVFAVPEPSTYALFMGGVVGILGLRARSRRDKGMLSLT